MTARLRYNPLCCGGHSFVLYAFIYKINLVFSSVSSTFTISLILLTYFLIYRIFDGYIKTYLKQKTEQRFNSNSILFDSLITELTISKSIFHIFNAFSLFSKIYQSYTLDSPYKVIQWKL